MKKFILDTFFFLLFSLVFYTTVLYFYGRYVPSKLATNIDYQIGSYGHMYSRLDEVKKTNDVDILFIGSSHSYRGFDPRIFLENGFKTFNLGSSSQTPTQTLVLLNRYLENLNPKTIVYEVYPVTFTIDGVESSLDIIANDKNDLYSIKMALKINNIKTYNTALYGFINDLFSLNKSFVEPIIKRDDKYISGGFVEKEIQFYKPVKFKQQDIIPNNKQLDSFYEIVKLLKMKNIELILVYAPIPKVNYGSYTNTSYFDSLMHKNATYYNFNKIITLNDSLDFFDSDHLNQNGVIVFNNKLIELLKTR